MSELKLNIYNKNKIEKTYIVEDAYINTGIVETIFDLVDIDKLMNESTTQEELGRELLKIIVKGWGSFKQVIMELCDGLTEEEWKKTKLNEVAQIIIAILQNALSSLNDIGGTEKK